MSYEKGFNEIVKIAGVKKEASNPNVSSYGQDFLAGFDPFGLYTTTQARRAEEAGLSDEEHALKRGINTAGGFVGGALFLPSAISSISEGVKGLSGGGSMRQRMARGAASAVDGFKKPIRELSNATRASRDLRRLSNNNIPLSDSAARNVQNVAGKAPINSLRGGGGGGGVGGSSPGHGSGYREKLRMKRVYDNPANMTAQDARVVQPHVDGAVRSGTTQLGMGGVVGAGGAYLQYGKGRETERETSIEARMKRRFSGGNRNSGNRNPREQHPSWR